MKPQKHWISEGEFLPGIFHIEKGTVVAQKDNHILYTYQKDDILFADQIFSYPYALYDYIVMTMTEGHWILKELLDSRQLATYLSERLRDTQLHLELLYIKDPITRICRYFYYEFHSQQSQRIYLKKTMKELATYLQIAPKELSSFFRILAHRQILEHQNKLFYLLSEEKIRFWAFRRDY